MFERAKRFYEEHETACTVAFFVAGFLFDTLFVGRIDKLHNIIHQASYLSLCALFTSLELREQYGRFAPPERLKGAWRYQQGATHFMLGTLLNIYTLFFFKSASLVTSFAFMMLLAGLLAVNELKPFESSGTTMRMSLFSLCLISYFTYLVPVVIGSLGFLVFLGSLLCASGVIALLAWWLKTHMADNPWAVFKHLVIPYGAVAVVFAGLYFAKLIPPVPLSLSGIGIYHEIHREGDRFALTMTRPRWRFWEKGDQTFLARKQDSVFCFVSVFSPTRFHERLRLRWIYKHPEVGWEQEDEIPLAIIGGRDEGWRGFAAKSRYKPGKWRVEVVTSDERELGRIGFSVTPDESAQPREERTIYR